VTFFGGRSSLVLTRSRDLCDGSVPISLRFFRRCCTSLQSLWHSVVSLRKILLPLSLSTCSLSPACTSLVLWKADINYVTSLGQKLWHATISEVLDLKRWADQLPVWPIWHSRSCRSTACDGNFSVSFRNRIGSYLVISLLCP